MKATTVMPINRRAGMWNWMKFMNHPSTWRFNFEPNEPRRLSSKELKQRKVRQQMQRESRKRNRSNWY